MNIVLLGPPGVGKGTQADPVAKRLGIPKLATGDVLRAARRQGPELGLRAQAAMDRGELVPDEVILGILKEAMARPDATRGVVLDGAVRTVPQAEGLERAMRELGRKVDVVLMFDAPEAELVRRLSSRVTCDMCQTPFTEREPGEICPKCGGKMVRRPDDEPEAVRNRLRVYREQTAPVIDWYRSHGVRFVCIDAVGPVEEVTSRVLDALGQ
jgi:adenylate kinase